MKKFLFFFLLFVFIISIFSFLSSRRQSSQTEPPVLSVSPVPAFTPALIPSRQVAIQRSPLSGESLKEARLFTVEQPSFADLISLVPPFFGFSGPGVVLSAGVQAWESNMGTLLVSESPLSIQFRSTLTPSGTIERENTLDQIQKTLSSFPLFSDSVRIGVNQVHLLESNGFAVRRARSVESADSLEVFFDVFINGSRLVSPSIDTSPIKVVASNGSLLSFSYFVPPKTVSSELGKTISVEEATQKLYNNEAVLVNVSSSDNPGYQQDLSFSSFVPQQVLSGHLWVEGDRFFRPVYLFQGKTQSGDATYAVFSLATP